MAKFKGYKKKHLLRLAHNLKPSVHVGKKGVTENLIVNINNTLSTHELVKIKFLNHKAEKKELSNTIAERTQSELLEAIGNIAILYKKSVDPKKRQNLLKRKALPPKMLGKRRNTKKRRKRAYPYQV
jgi:RNA-binding protein